jgi:hypothetical protein
MICAVSLPSIYFAFLVRRREFSGVLALHIHIPISKILSKGKSSIKKTLQAVWLIFEQRSDAVYMDLPAVSLEHGKKNCQCDKSRQGCRSDSGSVLC